MRVVFFWHFPPLHTTVCALHFYREEISALPSSARVELCLATLLIGALSGSFFFLSFFGIFFSKSRHGGIRTPGPTLLTVLIVAFEGNL